jgi:outer membrane receptor protein involved in Fe transport
MRHQAIWLALAGLFIIARPAPAQELADAVSGRQPRFLLASGGSTVPLDVARTPVLLQRLALDLDGVSLREALKAITSRTRLRLVYNDDVVPLETRVHLKADDIAVGPALMDVLLDTGIDVVFHPDGHAVLVRRSGDVLVQTGAIAGRVTDRKSGTPIAGATIALDGSRRSATTGGDGRYRIAEVAPATYTVRARYIGYAPGSASVTVGPDQEATADVVLEKSAQRLDEVVTTGTIVPTEVKALPTPITVVTADDIERQNLQRIDQVFRGQVPGAIAWDQGPALDYASRINVRGASTILGANPSIKTFIDGVEVAEPIYNATIDPNTVERIEVTRGPQASTLYGAGALDGVLQIFTKKGKLGLARPEVRAKLSAGGIGGFDGQSTAPQTDNTASILGGSDNTSYNLGGSYRHVGDWVPNFNSEDWNIAAGGQTKQGPFSLSSSLRYTERTFDNPWDTRFQSYTYLSKPDFFNTRLRQRTYGITASVQASRNWQHTLTLGYDQTYWTALQTQPRFTTPDDSLLSVYETRQGKASLLYHTDLRFRIGPAVTAAATIGVNYDSYDYGDAFTSGATHTSGGLDGFTFTSRSSSSNTGYFGQAQVGLAERVFFTAGLRAERNANFGANYGTAWSPRVGAAYILPFGVATLKLRASYGESVREPIPGIRDATVTPTYQYLANPNLAPERQRGVDGGAELYLGRTLSLGVTYYSQRVVDLIAAVPITTPPGVVPTYQYQNVSRVRNQGWEFEGRIALRPMEVSGTYSITNSTIQALPPDYPPGGYQVGDRIIGVPHTSAGLNVACFPLAGTTLSASMTHIGHWINSDLVAFYGFIYGGQPYRGSQRAYWMEYPSVTKFAVGVSQVLTNNLTAFARAENVGNSLRFEYSNSSIPAPRSVVVGANVRY